MFSNILIFMCICSFATSKNIFEMTQDWAGNEGHEFVHDLHKVEHKAEKEYRYVETQVEEEYDKLTNEMERGYVAKEVVTKDYQDVHDADREALQDYLTIEEILRKPRIPEKYTTGFRLGVSNGFEWSSCGTADDIVTFDKISVQPDTLVFPGNVTVAVSGKINADMNAPIPLDFSVQKKIGPAWVTVPCQMLAGCHIDDVCIIMAKMCPPNLPCKCPIKAGPINVPPTTKQVMTQIPTGDYKMHMSATNSDKEVFCLDITMSIG